MLDIPENIKDLFRADNTRTDTAKRIKLRFFDKEIDLLFPDDLLFPSDNLFPVDMEPFLTIENNQISTESLNITESLCDSKNVVFGECNASKVEITVADVTLDLTGKEFLLTIEIGSYELAMGIYRVDSFIRQADRRMRKITAYDRMQYFQKDVTEWYQGLTFPISLKEFRNSLCNHIGISQVSIELPLDDIPVTKTIDPQQLFGLDVLRNICEINGCFGNIDKTGRLRYAALGVSSLFPAENLYPAEDLFPAEMLNAEHVSHYKQSETTYEDYIVYGIDKLQIRQEEGDVGAIYGNGENGYVVQGNFLVYGKSANELLQIAATLYEQISGRIYRPIKVTCAALPWVEVGDGIVCHTTDEIIETYCFKRTIKGIQAMTDTFEADGSQNQEDDFGINTQIIQLEGKAAVIIRNVEEVSVRVTDLKNYAEAQFKITAEQILAEVTRAKGEEEKLSSRITINAESITLEVKRATKSEGELSSKITQTAESITAEVKRATEAEASIIKVTSDAISLKVSKGDVTGQLNSELKITGNSIQMTTGHFTIDAGNIKVDSSGNAWFGGKIEVGLLYADDESVQIGGFESKNAWGRDVFQAYDETTGMSADPASRGQLHMWAGWNSDTDYAFCVNNKKEVHCYEIYIESHQSFWQGWSLSRTMDDMYDRMQRAEDAINDLRDQVNSME